jgi:hypothetical protein
MNNEITKIDKNLKISAVENPDELSFHDVRKAPFSVYGLYNYQEKGPFRRIPAEVAENTNNGVKNLSKNTAGARVRFSTDSPFIAIRAIEPYSEIFPHITIGGKNGFSLYSDKAYL